MDIQTMSGGEEGVGSYPSLVEFNAGKMTWDQGGDKMVVADKTKGKVVLSRSQDDDLLMVQWFNRETGEFDHEQNVIVCDDAYLERVTKVSSGRVYVLKYTTSSLRKFFWMQNIDETNEEELVNKFNQICNAPGKGGNNQQFSLEGSSGNAEPVLTHTQSRVAGNSSSSASIPSALSQEAISATFSQILAGKGSAGGGGGKTGDDRDPPVSLQDILNTKVLKDLVANATNEEVNGMLEHLPASQRSKIHLEATVASPQIQQNAGALNLAVHSEQVAVLFSILGLDISLLQGMLSKNSAEQLEILCKAMEKKHKKQG